MRRAKLAHVRLRDVRGRPIKGSLLTEREMRSRVFRILEENVLCSIATVTSRNQAHINTAYFCYSDDLALYFLSHPRSRHCRNLARRPVIAVTVFSSRQPWGAPGRGLQLFGRCERTSGAQAGRAERLYGRRFPKYARWRATLAAGAPGEEYRFYRLVVGTLKILDEEALGDAAFGSATVTRHERKR